MRSIFALLVSLVIVAGLVGAPPQAPRPAQAPALQPVETCDCGGSFECTCTRCDCPLCDEYQNYLAIARRNAAIAKPMLIWVGGTRPSFLAQNPEIPQITLSKFPGVPRGSQRLIIAKPDGQGWYDRVEYPIDTNSQVIYNQIYPQRYITSNPYQSFSFPSVASCGPGG